MLHGFNLVTSSVFGNSTASNVLKQAQRLITGTKATTTMQQHVKDLAKLNSVNVGLQPAGTTRFSSQYSCLNSVGLHQNVFQPLITDEVKRSTIPSATATQLPMDDIINDSSFWLLLRQLKDFMLPFQQV